VTKISHHFSPMKSPLTPTLPPTVYRELLMAVKNLLEEGRTAGEAVDSGLAVVYWKIGDRIVGAGLTGKDHYGKSVLERLAKDLGIASQTLRRAVVFRRVYEREILYRSVQNLTWSHYRLLIEVGNDEARAYYEEQTMKNGWSRDRLRVAVAGREFEREVKGDKTAGVLKRPTDMVYVFWAEVLDVIDGDTLVLDVDCGFNVKIKQRIRLAGLDAWEAETKKGKEATDYVRDRLGKAVGVAVKTARADTYGRYVGHVFYSDEEGDVENIYREGRYLNEELLKKGLAQRM